MQAAQSLASALLPAGASGRSALPSRAAAADYLASTLVPLAFAPRRCGDGRCDAPEESAAWGPHGCRADCGGVPGALRVVVALSCLGFPGPGPSRRARRLPVVRALLRPYPRAHPANHPRCIIISAARPLFTQVDCIKTSRPVIS